MTGQAKRSDGSIVEIVGQIDRLAETDEEVFIADYKSGQPRAAADTPTAYITQLALYRHVVAPLYPGRALRVFLIWIGGPQVIEIDADVLDDAFREAIG